MIRLAVFDLDGTLLRDDKTISSYSQSVIHRFIEQGGEVAVASGRSINGIKMYQDMIHASHFITINGSCTYCHDEIIDRIVFDEQKIIRLVQELLKIKDGKIFITYPTYVLTNDLNDHRSIVQHTDFSSFDTTQVHQISIVTEERELVNQINPEDYDCKRISYADEPNRFVFVLKSIDKFKGISKLCEKLGLALDEVAVFGDDYNDLGMIQNMPISIVPDNAVDYVKQYASFICASNEEDGPCKWIEENILKDF